MSIRLLLILVLTSPVFADPIETWCGAWNIQYYFDPNGDQIGEPPYPPENIILVIEEQKSGTYATMTFPDCEECPPKIGTVTEHNDGPLVWFETKNETFSRLRCISDGEFLACDFYELYFDGSLRRRGPVFADQQCNPHPLKRTRGNHMQKCEKCGGGVTSQFDLHDYCAICGKNLCEACMEAGHCGHTPALSGMEADEEEGAGATK